MSTSVVLLGLFILLLFIENQRERIKMHRLLTKEISNYFQEDIAVKKSILEEINKRSEI
jgi:hypothetical protein